MTIFNASTVQERRRRAAEALAPKLRETDLLLVFCGEPIQKPGGLDQTYEFLPHPDYYWLTGQRRAGGVTAFSLSDGFVDFVKPLGFDETLWEGKTEASSGRDVAQLESWIQARKYQRIFRLGQAGSYEKFISQNISDEERIHIQETFNQVRRVKDPAEIQLIKDAAKMAQQGYLKLKQFIRPGVSERQIQIEFETAVRLAGAEKFPYDTIVGAGGNSAILHAIPTQRILQKGEHVLIDAGADIQDYCVDITRIFPASGSLDQRQKDIFNIVRQAQVRSIESCRVGTDWHDVHRVSAQVMADGLKNLGLLVGETQDLLDSGTMALFFPHGVGHMVGHRVRDVGADITKPARTCCGVRVRVDLTLRENYLMTVEPGLYFIPALLNQTEIRQKHKAQVNWDEVEKWLDFGGIRLEDDILVTAQGPENLTGFIEQ